VQSGEFPKPFRLFGGLGERGSAAVWDEDEIEAFLKGRKNEHQ
jgi:predicted DNA-binding transcriptional regulator AlpA